MSACQRGRRIWGEGRQTIVHTPLRSWIVLSGGAAIVEVFRSVVWD